MGPADWGGIIHWRLEECVEREALGPTRAVILVRGAVAGHGGCGRGGGAVDSVPFPPFVVPMQAVAAIAGRQKLGTPTRNLIQLIGLRSTEDNAVNPGTEHVKHVGNCLSDSKWKSVGAIERASEQLREEGSQ